MSTPSPKKPPMRGAVAGMMIVGSLVAWGLVGLGAGALLGVTALGLVLGLFVGLAAGTFGVYTRFRDL
jgi:F0F1-type ATP synthase assembly protein I